MPEIPPVQITHAEQIQREASLESLNEALERLRYSLEFVPEATIENPEEMPQVSYHAFRHPDGSCKWSRLHGTPSSVTSYIEAKPTENEEDSVVFGMAEEHARSDDIFLKAVAREEGKWWIYTKSEAIVESNFKEVARIQEGDHQIDILNCSDRLLDEKDKTSIVKVFNAVARYTENKVFSRVKGIVLAPGREFPDNVAGDYQPAAQTLRLNMDALDEKEALERYKDYFEEGDTNWFEIVLAHEIGHAFDISSVHEAELHGVKDAMRWNGPEDLSAFQSLDGWKYSEAESDSEYRVEHKWEFDSEGNEEVVECVPTKYGLKNPREDFAETFAIVALGGDTSSIRIRADKVAETVRLATGDACEQKEKLQLKDIENPQQELIKPITQISTRVFVSG